ncbi:soyasapogenol B glucuronide galactosyltransferase-like [Chenopodium quinoa]|uniref:soyasapogenol B glucuronide galactosyltransferase-like n=1 Tax=Chenopodium quinoa TaxID=63459 RepID=UPI000B77E1B7|nr:soyasapogenol B glucuronide galactosyltransferase-like [Chenopodium quinoa]
MELKIIFLPFPTPGHILPMADLAKTLASHGVECIIITTPANAPLFQTSDNNLPITIHALPFPAADVGLPPGIENFSKIASDDMRSKIFTGIHMLGSATQDLIRDLLPLDCIVSDMFYPWTSDFAAEIGVPRVFQLTSSIFSSCCGLCVKFNAPHEQVENDDDFVTLPSLPHKIEMRKSQIPLWVRIPNRFTYLMNVIREAELKSTWVLANTFGEAEKEYEECYNKLTGIKVLNIGPLFFCNKKEDDKASSAELDCWKTCLDWLDQKKPRSVLYISFGSLTLFPDEQLHEIAAGLEASGHDFIWAVKQKKAEKTEESNEDEQWSVDEFRKKMEASNKGLIIQGWAPQKLILQHQAIGGMVTHCGWNTLLEGVSIAGVPIITWPQFAEQFYNERLVVDVLKIGVAVGVTQWCNLEDTGKEFVSREKVETAVRAVMDSSEIAAEMRQRAKKLSETSKGAVKNGGSSQANLLAFLDELKTRRSKAV